MKRPTARLGLGTVQFGLSYGVSNTTGQVPEPQVRGILECAGRAGVTTLDTASAYGDSEAVLGRNLPEYSFSVVTKTVPLPAGEITARDVETVEDGLQRSLQRLRQDSVYGVLVHHAQNLLCPGGQRLYELLARWKQEGRVRKIGASVYDGSQVRQLRERFSLDLVQLPLNIFDQRLVADGTLQVLEQSAVEVHVRSVFLQGLLLMSEQELPAPLRRFGERVAAYRGRVAELGCSPLEAALGFVKHFAGVEVTLVGVNSEQHLRECIAAYERAAPQDWSTFACADADLVDPRRWKLQ